MAESQEGLVQSNFTTAKQGVIREFTPAKPMPGCGGSCNSCGCRQKPQVMLKANSRSGLSTCHALLSCDLPGHRIDPRLTADLPPQALTVTAQIHSRNVVGVGSNSISVSIQAQTHACADVYCPQTQGRTIPPPVRAHYGPDLQP